MQEAGRLPGRQVTVRPEIAAGLRRHLWLLGQGRGGGQLGVGREGVDEVAFGAKVRVLQRVGLKKVR